MYVPYNKETAGAKDRIAWALCQIIDDDAPLRWTRYRFAAECIANNAELMADLEELKRSKNAYNKVVTSATQAYPPNSVADMVSIMQQADPISIVKTELGLPVSAYLDPISMSIVLVTED